MYYVEVDERGGLAVFFHVRFFFFLSGFARPLDGSSSLSERPPPPPPSVRSGVYK